MFIPGEASGRRFTVETLPADVLEIDPGVQRALNKERVKTLADNFDESALGVFIVSARKELTLPGQGEVSASVATRYVVLDGQTRLAALRRFVGGEKTAYPVLCQVFQGLTRQEEAETFLSHNNRAAIRPLDKFRLAVVAQEPWALELDRTVREHGFEIGRGARPSHRFTAVVAARRILSLPDGQDALNRALDLTVRAWGHRRNTASAEAIDGLGLLYQRHGEAVDTVGFARKLVSLDTPQTFKGGVLALYSSETIHRTEAAYRYVVRMYNKGRKNEAYKLTLRGPRS